MFRATHRADPRRAGRPPANLHPNTRKLIGRAVEAASTRGPDDIQRHAGPRFQLGRAAGAVQPTTLELRQQGLTTAGTALDEARCSWEPLPHRGAGAEYDDPKNGAHNSYGCTYMYATGVVS